jgi:hypothetical protein
MCIDALDEVDDTTRIRLLEALNYVMKHSKNLVKVFATTRMDPDIVLQFEFFPRIELQPDDNFGDIKNFVEMSVQQAIDDKRLLHGAVPLDLKEEVCGPARKVKGNVSARCKPLYFIPMVAEKGGQMSGFS